MTDWYNMASNKKPVMNQIAVQTIRDRYASYPSRGLTPERLARIFKEADQGDIVRQAELFEEMEEKDLHLAGCIQTRKLAVAGLDWEILPVLLCQAAGALIGLKALQTLFHWALWK